MSESGNANNEAPSYEKPDLEAVAESEVADEILNYHRRICEAPVLYEKDQGPQEQIDGVWIGGNVFSLDEARERDLDPHVNEIDEYDESDAFDLDHVEWLLGGGNPDEAEFHTSRLNRGLNWMWPLINEMPYGWWTSGAVPAGQPSYGENAKAPDRASLKKRTVFCVGVPTLLLRSIGKRVPTAGNPLYDGGTYAYGVYFRQYAIPFSVSRVQPGDLLLDFFQSSVHQGHGAVVLNGNILLQSYDGNQYKEGGYNGPGLSKGISVATSARYNDYDVIIRRENWIDYAGDEPGFAAVA